MSADDVIRTHQLTRYFGRRAVVRELDFSVPRGSVVGLLGLNGAGKTTTIRMLLGFLEPTRGGCELLGRDSRELTPADRARIGHTVEGHFLYPWMRVRECESFGRELTHAGTVISSSKRSVDLASTPIPKFRGSAEGNARVFRWHQRLRATRSY